MKVAWMKVQFGSCLITLLLLFSASGVFCQNETFSFVQVCDPQLGMGGYEHDMGTLRQAVEQINALDCDFVVICGDLVHHASDSSFTDFLGITEGFTMPVYLVAGNHDVGNVPNDTTLKYYRDKIGEDYYAFEYKAYGFIITNTQLWKNHVGKESEVHHHWFNETLSKMKEEQLPVIVAGHHPFFIKDVEEAEQYSNLPIETRQELLDLFAGNNVVAYLSGHRHETLLNNYNGIQLITGETTSKNFDKRALGFRQWKVSGDSVAHHFVPLRSLN